MFPGLGWCWWGAVGTEEVELAVILCELVGVVCWELLSESVTVEEELLGAL